MLIKNKSVHFQVTAIGEEYYLVEFDGRPAHVPVKLARVMLETIMLLSIIIEPFFIDEAVAGKPQNKK